MAAEKNGKLRSVQALTQDTQCHSRCVETTMMSQTGGRQILVPPLCNPLASTWTLSPSSSRAIVTLLFSCRGHPICAGHCATIRTSTMIVHEETNTTRTTSNICSMHCTTVEGTKGEGKTWPSAEDQKQRPVSLAEARRHFTSRAKMAGVSR